MWKWGSTKGGETRSPVASMVRWASRVEAADGGDGVAGDADVGDGAVGEGAALDEEVEGHQRSPRL